MSFFEKLKQFYGIKINGLDIFIKSDLGFGNGLGSSSAMSIGVFSVLNIFIKLLLLKIVYVPATQIFPSDMP